MPGLDEVATLLLHHGGASPRSVAIFRLCHTNPHNGTALRSVAILQDGGRGIVQSHTNSHHSLRGQDPWKIKLSHTKPYGLRPQIKLQILTAARRAVAILQDGGRRIVHIHTNPHRGTDSQGKGGALEGPGKGPGTLGAFAPHF